jgi:hypothetical protein
MIIFVESNNISEMSMGQKKQELYYTHYTHNIVEHLLKLFYFRNGRDYNVWVNHLYKNTPEAPKFRHTNKWPGKDFIYQWLWWWVGDDFSTVYGRDIGLVLNLKGYDTKKIKADPKMWVAQKFCNDYFNWASDKLSQSGKVTPLEVIKKVESLLKKYPY